MASTAYRRSDAFAHPYRRRREVEMPGVFISYSRHDLSAVEPLERALQNHDIAVWRDQESIYGGQQWPKAIGEAIAAHDYVLLIWSKSSAQSHFVEFEWNSAIALRKTILPCCLDDTPLPPALSAINAIDVRQLDEALPRILQALQRPVPAPNPGHSGEVIAQLRSMASTQPEEVVQTAKMLFAQQGWSVQGNVYQAARDIHLTIAQPEARPEKSLVDRWQTWVALFVGVLTITALGADLPGKIRKIVAPDESTMQVILQPLSGVIWGEGHEPLPGVEVVLPEFKQATTTDRHGAFAFQVKAHKQRTVDVIARKDGYTTHDADATLGNTALNFTMRRKP
jgi:TIR domain